MNYQFAEMSLEEMEAPGKPPANKGMCPSPTSSDISRFPIHSNRVDTLPPVEREKIRQAARLIVKSLAASCPAPLSRVSLVGHADRDVAQGVAFEMRISRERAEAVRNALRDDVMEFSRAAHITPPDISSWSLQGLGATQLRVARPRSEVERQLNRRVVIQLMADASPPFVPYDVQAVCMRHCAVRKSQCLKYADPHVRNLCITLAADFCRSCARARRLR